MLEIASDPAPVQIDVPETILRAHDQPTPELPYEPPLSPSRIRPAVTALLARPRRSTRPDLPRLIRAVARCSPLRCIPYEHERSLSQGVTVVADIGPAMIPYLADVDFLLEQIQNTVGMSSTAVRWIDDDPVPLELPRERPVLVITSLGTRRKARWLRALPAEVVALVPQRGMGLPGAALTVAWDDLPKVVRRHG
ncbi:hypothetical protein [Kineosporia succinea]|uniref:Uncharacterized protein n=1 Tax=Kineosporia succinea TaxID=84632 RepID=A0ABT9PDB8_9ACTN|nr:hypothetical protein [Kineosporia succinea]MDP9830160.1 hypothetical protein [Kineosporia succinea]